MMKFIDRILFQLEVSVRTGNYLPIETEQLELKDLSGGPEWKELYRSVNAFLNTEGGVVIIGVKEAQIKGDKKGEYRFTGFNPDNESKLFQLRQIYNDENGNILDLSAYFPTWQFRPFLNGRVCVLFVEKLPEDEKYVFYKGVAYQRIATGDYEISSEKLIVQRERREELRNARELLPVPGTTLDTLNVDKLNDYISRINKETRVETLKADIRQAIPFLRRKFFIREDNTPTLLGVFLCADHVADILRGKCQIDCYVESLRSDSTTLIGATTTLRDNINPLIEQCHAFMSRNIRVGVTVERGGSPLPEYPEKLLRETINNAIAHRDYKSDRFSIVSITPQSHISIRNPGVFRPGLLVRFDAPIPETGDRCKIRRIIPDSQAQNSRLNDILKEFNKWEGRGIGMATLTNEALNNTIGVPHYILRSNEIELVIPSGKVLTAEMLYWLAGFDAFIYRATGGRDLTEEEMTVMAYLYRCELLNRDEKYTVLFNQSNNHYGALSALESAGLIIPIRSKDAHTDVLVYIVHRTLTNLKYDNELRAMFGGDYDSLRNDYKDVLCIIYQHNCYAIENAPSANRISNVLLTRNTQQHSPDNFKRTVRHIVRRLEEKEMIVRNDGTKPNYVLNKEFRRTPSIFD